MLSRTHTFFGGIYSFALAGGLIAFLVAFPEAPGWCWLIAIGLVVWGAWDIYQALAGRKKDRETAADLEQRISSLGVASPPVPGDKSSTEKK